MTGKYSFCRLVAKLFNTLKLFLVGQLRRRPRGRPADGDVRGAPAGSRLKSD